MIANAYWLREIAAKHNITGIDRQLVDECADKLEHVADLADLLEQTAAVARKLSGPELREPATEAASPRDPRVRALEQLRQLRHDGDAEQAHATADDILLRLIDDPRITTAFAALRKWYG